MYIDSGMYIDILFLFKQDCLLAYHSNNLYFLNHPFLYPQNVCPYKNRSLVNQNISSFKKDRLVFP